MKHEEGNSSQQQWMSATDAAERLGLWRWEIRILFYCIDEELEWIRWRNDCECELDADVVDGYRSWLDARPKWMRRLFRMMIIPRGAANLLLRIFRVPLSLFWN